jgi:hypothetical protein
MQASASPANILLNFSLSILPQYLSIPDTSEMAKRRSYIDLTTDDTPGTTNRKSYIDLTTDDDGDYNYANTAREQVYANASQEDYPKARARREGRKLEAKQREKKRMSYGDQWRSMEGRPTKRMFFQSTLARNLVSQDPLQRWNDYLAAFRPVPAEADLDLLLLWRRDDVPWPTPSGLEEDISEDNIRRFIKKYTLKYSEQAGGDWKKAVRQNQVLWHPDKFRQLLARKLERLTEDDRKRVEQRVNEISQILNGLANEI